MENRNDLVGNAANDNSRWCFAKARELYLVCLPTGGTAELNLVEAPGEFEVRWFNPRAGGALGQGSVAKVRGGGVVKLGTPPAEAEEDWLAVVRAAKK